MESLGSADTIGGVARLEADYPCEWADPQSSGVELRDATHVISGSFSLRTTDYSPTVGASVMVDSPAWTAERLEYLRRLMQECSAYEVRKEVGGELFDVTWTRDPDPAVDADESLGGTRGEEGEQGVFPFTVVCARSGGIAVCLSSNDDDPIPEAALAAALGRARAALGS